MGSGIEINDTLKISRERGFPSQLTLKAHAENPAGLFESVKGKLFLFWNKDERLYHRPPTRVFLVEEIDGKWLYWGHAMVREQTVKNQRTEGIFEVVKIYDLEYQQTATINESPAGKSFF